ncbi:translocation protein SEC63 homolog [Amphibalanus amphitrite]|uniref:translocation protein SEC63 homolog n=1 Tax=Amphibalanus amphitrite TaxID=1232801 RepID=UPI001C8FAFEB|nr:translocation protein SEC63 homolog [Amphibalanus amphitrite]
MAGQKFEYDESGSTFYYFLLCFLGLVLGPASYYYFIKDDKKDDSSQPKDGSVCQCSGCVRKRHLLKSKEPSKKWKRRTIQIVLILGWIAVAILVQRVREFDYEYANFDPYDILGVSPGARKADIKKAYKMLSLTEHPDKGGDEKKFVKINKAYQALTDDIARRNWELYGNPDGPGVMNFGIALPSWIVQKENSIWVLGVYTLVFMIALPTVVGIWWYNSIKFSGDQVLLDTTQLYFYFFHKTPHMMLRRVLMVLSASLEFERGHNSEVQMRESDNFEVPLLIKRLPNLGENNKERPLCFEYSVKARCLLHAHLTRLPLPPATLEIDRQLVVRKCPYLIQEMVTCISQLVMLAHAGRIARLPSLETIDNTMKLCPMVVQALWDSKSVLLQLPHVDEAMLRHFVDKKRKINVKTLQQLAELDALDRRHVLRNLSDEEAHNVENVLMRMPHVTMDVTSEVLDDENSGEFTAGAITTVTVKLTRRDLGEASGPQTERAAAPADDDPDGAGDEVKAESKEKTTPVWKSSSKKKAKTGKKSSKKTKLKQATKPDESPKPSSERSEGHGSGSDEAGSGDESDHSDGGSDSDGSAAASRPGRTADERETDDEEWERFQSRINKRGKALETKSRVSHPVHAPHFPDEKQEYWWVYVCDRKNKGLVTAPFQVTDLVTEAEVELKFTAPKKPGLYTFTVVLRSDSYLGFDQTRDIKLDVKQAYEIPVEHPQWDISDEEEKSDDESDVDEFATDDEFDASDMDD